MNLEMNRIHMGRTWSKFEWQLDFFNNDFFYVFWIVKLFATSKVLVSLIRYDVNFSTHSPTPIICVPNTHDTLHYLRGNMEVVYQLVCTWPHSHLLRGFWTWVPSSIQDWSPRNLKPDYTFIGFELIYLTNITNMQDNIRIDFMHYQRQ